MNDEPEEMLIKVTKKEESEEYQLEYIELFTKTKENIELCETSVNMMGGSSLIGRMSIYKQIPDKIGIKTIVSGTKKKLMNMLVGEFLGLSSIGDITMKHLMKMSGVAAILKDEGKL